MQRPFNPIPASGFSPPSHTSYMSDVLPTLAARADDGWLVLPAPIHRTRSASTSPGSCPQITPPISPTRDSTLNGSNAGLEADAFIEVVRNTITDGQVHDWVRTHVRRTPDAKEAFNRWLLNRGHRRA